MFVRCRYNQEPGFLGLLYLDIVKSIQNQEIFFLDQSHCLLSYITKTFSLSQFLFKG